MKTRIPRRRPEPSPRSQSREPLRPPVPKPEVIELVPAVLRVRSVLVPVDFSPPSEKALRYAAAFARQFDASLTLLHVLEPMAAPDFAYFPLTEARERVARAARKRLKELARRLGSAQGRVEFSLVRDGRAWQVITDVARERRCSLIIMATHGLTGAARVILGSTTERVVRHAPCPVLVVRETETEFA